MNKRGKDRRYARILAGAAALALFVCSFTAGLTLNTVETGAAVTLPTEKNITNTKLRLGDLFTPGRAGQWCYVYYGTPVSGNYVKYRVLDTEAIEYGGHTLLLDCDYVMTKAKYAPSSNSWVDSEIREYLNGEYLTEHFSVAEAAALFPATKDAPSVRDGRGYPLLLSFSPLSDDKAFIPDAAELTSSYYGYQDSVNTLNIRKKSLLPDGGITKYWLRSAHKTMGRSVGVVEPDEGKIQAYYVEDSTMGVSPFINIDRAYIICTTKISGVSGQPQSCYKLTIKDNTLSAGITEGQSVTRLGDTLTIPYTTMGDVNRLTALITRGAWDDPDAEIKYYAPIVTGTAAAGSGTAQFELPEDFDASWHTYILAERAGDDIRLTDYASLPADISVPAPIIYNVTCEGDGHGTASATPDRGPYRTEVSLSPSPESGYRFTHWEVISGGVSINEVTDPSAKFTVKTDNVRIKAHFELIPPPQYEIRFNPNRGRLVDHPETVITGTDQKLHDELPIPVRVGYVFKGWYTQASGGEKITLDRVYTGDTEIFAQWKGDLSTVRVNLGPALTYNGNEQTQTIQSVVYEEEDADTILTEGRDYVVSGNKGMAAGDYTLTLSAPEGSDYTGIGKKVFTIARKSITPTVNVSGTYTYTGQPQKPSYTIKDGSTELAPTDYRLTYADNINAGTGKMIFVAGSKGNYAFSDKTVEFPIGKAVWSGETEITKTYALTDSYPDSIDLDSALPVDAGRITYGTPSSSGSVAYESTPSLSGSILSYQVKAAASATTGLITVSATTQNYSNNFSIKINIRQQSIALMEKVRSRLDPISSKELTVGKTVNLAAKIPGGTGKERFIWSSSNPNIARVTQDGSVATFSRGTAVISVFEENDPDSVAKCFIYVRDPVTAVVMDRPKQVLGKGESAMLSAQILPFTAIPELQWSSSAPGVVIVCDEDGNELPGEIVGKHKDYRASRKQKVMIKGVGSGTAKVTAYATYGTGSKGTCTVTVGNPVPDFEIYGTANRDYVVAGKTLGMKVNWGDVKPKNQGIGWKVSEIDEYGNVIGDASGIATINDKGVVTGLDEGRIRVTATSLGNAAKYATCDLEVHVGVRNAYLNTNSGYISRADDANNFRLQVNVVPTVAGKHVTGPEGLGSSVKITYLLPDAYRSYMDLDENTGLVTNPTRNAKSVPIVAKLEAADGYTKKFTCRVTIQEKSELKAIRISRTKITMGVGNVEQLESTLTPINPDGPLGVTWDTSDESVVTVDETGKVVAQGTGNATITLTALGQIKYRGKWIHPTATCKVTVRPCITEIRFTNGEFLEKKGLGAGKYYNLKPELILSGPGRPVSNALTWTSSDPSLVSVTSRGQIRAIKVGDGESPTYVTVTAKCKDKKEVGSAPETSVRFPVYALVNSIKLDKTQMTLGTQESIKYGSIAAATILPVDADNPAIEWKSANDKVELAVADLGTEPSSPGLQSSYRLAVGEGFTGDSTATGGEGVIVRKGQYLAVRAVKPGKVKVIGYTTDGSKKKTVCVVTVRGEITKLGLKTSPGKAGFSDITLADDSDPDVMKYEGSMKSGYGISLTPVYQVHGIWGNTTDKAEKKIYSAYKKYTDSGVSYRSSNTAVATVDHTGKVRVKKDLEEGATATIYVTSSDGKKVAEYKVTVKKEHH